MQNTFCPVCQANNFLEFIDFGVIPVSGLFLLEPETAFPSAQLYFEFCPSCALIKRKQKTMTCPDYRETNRATRGQMPEYVPELIEALTKRQPDPQSLIIDVGGNDGALLDKVAEAGYTRRLNIEPSIDLSNSSRESDHLVESVHLNSVEADRLREEYGLAAAILCRHVLEHVPDPMDFLTSMRSMLRSDGHLFIETPDARGILHGLLGHELWDEHLFHFTAENLMWLLNRAGFEVEQSEIRSHRGGTNILIWARHGQNQKNAALLENSLKTDVEFCRNFKDRWAALKTNIGAAILNWPRPIVGLGASHPQSNYFQFLSLGGKLEFLVDDDPDKIGCFVPLSHPVPVISTQKLLEGPLPGTIVRTAFGCEVWMDRVCQAFATKKVLVAEPYLTQKPWPKHFVAELEKSRPELSLNKKTNAL